MTIERLERQVWVWKDPTGMLHVLFERHHKPYAITKRDYVTGCGLDVGVDDVPKRNRIYGPASCLKCVATRMVDVINGEGCHG